MTCRDNWHILSDLSCASPTTIVYVAKGGIAVHGRQLVAYILDHEGIGAPELSAKLGVKDRAMRKRILAANDDMAGLARVVYNRALGGYVVEFADRDGFENWLSGPGVSSDRTATMPATPQERVAYVLQDLLCQNEWITLEDLSRVLNVSRSTLSNDLRKVEETLARFDLSLEKRPRHGMRVRGTEMSRRICLAALAVDATLADEQFPSGADASRLDTISRCVDDVLEHDGFKINSFAHHNLIVHIAIALARIERGCYVPLDPERDREMLSTREHTVARHVARAISMAFAVDLPESEIDYIAIHLASKRLLDSGKDGSVEESEDNLVISDEAWNLAASMIEAVWRSFRFDFRSDVELRMNLARHLMPLAVRLRYHMTLENVLLPEIKERYPLAYAMALDACGVLAQHFNATCSEAEVGYIALSFALAIERAKEEPTPKNLLVVCASGMGSARLLAYQIKRRFDGRIGSIATCDAVEFVGRDLSDIDYVLTTVPVERHVNKPVIEVSVFLSEDDSRNIADALSAAGPAPAASYLDRSLFFSGLPYRTREDVIDFLCEQIASRYPVRSDIRELVLKREELAATSFGNLVALPHPFEPASDETVVAVGLLDHEVMWGSRPVRAVFLICIADDAGDELEQFYRSLSQLLTKRKSVDRLLADMRFETLLQELEGETND